MAIQDDRIANLEIALEHVLNNKDIDNIKKITLMENMSSSLSIQISNEYNAAVKKSEAARKRNATAAYIDETELLNISIEKGKALEKIKGAKFYPLLESESRESVKAFNKNPSKENFEKMIGLFLKNKKSTRDEIISNINFNNVLEKDVKSIKNEIIRDEFKKAFDGAMLQKLFENEREIKNENELSLWLENAKKSKMSAKEIAVYFSQMPLPKNISAKNIEAKKNELREEAHKVGYSKNNKNTEDVAIDMESKMNLVRGLELAANILPSIDVFNAKPNKNNFDKMMKEIGRLSTSKSDEEFAKAAVNAINFSKAKNYIEKLPGSNPVRKEQEMRREAQEARKKEINEINAKKRAAEVERRKAERAVKIEKENDPATIQARKEKESEKATIQGAMKQSLKTTLKATLSYGYKEIKKHFDKFEKDYSRLFTLAEMASLLANVNLEGRPDAKKIRDEFIKILNKQIVKEENSLKGDLLPGTTNADWDKNYERVKNGVNEARNVIQRLATANATEKKVNDGITTPMFGRLMAKVSNKLGMAKKEQSDLGMTTKEPPEKMLNIIVIVDKKDSNNYKLIRNKIEIGEFSVAGIGASAYPHGRGSKKTTVDLWCKINTPKDGQHVTFESVSTDHSGSNKVINFKGSKPTFHFNDTIQNMENSQSIHSPLKKGDKPLVTREESPASLRKKPT